MPHSFDCTRPDQRGSGVRAAGTAVRAGGLVVTPTDTVYGVAADPFSPVAVQRLLDAKGRGRDFPPPVLVPGREVLDALTTGLPAIASTLADAFWPGALTLVVNADPTLDWDLGDTDGTVAVRMPDDPICLALLRETGPLAVSSANTHGSPSATDIAAARRMLGDSVDVYLDGGPSRGGESSTIVDVTAASDGVLRVLRHGAIALDAIAQVVAAATGTMKVVGACAAI